MRKTKLIKKYVGDVIKEEGFAYEGSDAGTWNFYRKKDKIKQRVTIMQHRFFPDKIKLIFYTGVYGWGDREPRHFISQYKEREFWNYKSEEEYIGILKLFSNIILDYGLDILDTMSEPKDSIYPTAEMNESLYQYYQNNLEELNRKYYENGEGAAGIENITRNLFQNRDKNFNDIKSLLIELAAIYTKIVQSELGGELILYQGERCALANIGEKKRLILPLTSIITRWKQYHEKMNVKYDVLLIQYQQLKE